jgi:hypothetical protein
MLTYSACELLHSISVLAFFLWSENLSSSVIRVTKQTFLLQARCAVTVFEAAGGSVQWHGSGTVGELHMRPLGDGMINFQLHDLLVSLQNPPVIFYCISSVVQLVKQ